MGFRSPLAKAAISAAGLASIVTAILAIPRVVAAQPVEGPPPADSYYACRQDQTGRAVGGAVLGGIAGAVIGGGIAHNGGGALIGGAAGATLGAGVGGSTADCGGPPPPPGAAYDQGPPPPSANYDDRYDDGRYDGGRCGPAEERIRYPDGSMQRYTVRACQDGYGRWYVTP